MLDASNWPQINLSKNMVSLHVKFCGLSAICIRVCPNYRYSALKTLSLAYGIESVHSRAIDS